MPTLRIAEFPPSHVCFERRPSCALFPVEASQLRIALKRVWLVYQRPLDPIFVGMDICIMPRRSSTVPIIATVGELSVIGAGWAVFRMCPRYASMGPFSLCVPLVWVMLPEDVHAPGQLSTREWFRFCRLSGVSPGVLDVALKDIYVPPEGPLNSHMQRAYHRSAESITVDMPSIVVSPGMFQLIWSSLQTDHI